jgi:uroporphyrinogen decarboxylase
VPRKQAVAALKGSPIICRINGGSHLLITAMADLSVDVLSVDWRQPLSEVRRLVGPRVLQGNLDPAALLAPIPEIQRRTAALIEQGKGGGTS